MKRVGTVVGGRWRLDELLGWGSTAAVYSATHRNGHRAALKILHQSLCGDRTACERFLREAGIANAVKHRAVVPVRDDGMTEDGCAYLVLELLEGETLEDRRKKSGGTMPIEDLASIAEELMSALSAVHRAGVVHRDLKPQNVFLTKTQLKLLDFGTARIIDASAGSSTSVQGLVIGTPAFMSPEQARGARDEIDAQSDVWSLGATLFTVLSGEYVHVGRDAQKRLLAAASKPARKLGEVCPTIDERVAMVVDRALAFDKSERWPDVRAMRKALRAAAMESVPSLRDLKAYTTVAAAEPDPGDSEPGTVSISESSLALQTPQGVAISPVPSATMPAEGRTSTEPDAPAVAATNPHPVVHLLPSRKPASLAVVAAAGLALVAGSVLFLGSVGDPPAVHPASASEPPPPPQVAPEAPAAAPAAPVAPAASFIVITAPDDPTSPKKAAPTAAEVEAWKQAVKARAEADAKKAASARPDEARSPETQPGTKPEETKPETKPEAKEAPKPVVVPAPVEDNP